MGPSAPLVGGLKTAPTSDHEAPTHQWHRCLCRRYAHASSTTLPPASRPSDPPSNVPAVFSPCLSTRCPVGWVMMKYRVTEYPSTATAAPTQKGGSSNCRKSKCCAVPSLMNTSVATTVPTQNAGSRNCRKAKCCAALASPGIGPSSAEGHFNRQTRWPYSALAFQR